MERLDRQNAGERTSIRRVALASLIGTTIEWYDFFLYGTAAALVFNTLFFPELDSLMGTLAAFATFATGFFARPVGGIVFGHFGDRTGRKTMLILSLLIMGIATFAIGLLPTYAGIGVWAPVLLVVMRLLQGFAVGGEWGGAVLMAVEHSPVGSRGFYGSFPQVGGAAGLLLSTGAFAVFSSLPEEQFMAWGWRMPFLLSIILVAVGLYIRLHILETPVFSQVRESRTEARLPVIEVLRTQPKNIILAIGARLAEATWFYLLVVFILAYATEQLGLPRRLILTGVLIGAAIELFTIPAFAALSDRLGRRPVYMGGALFSVLFAFPFFWIVDTQVTVLIWLAIVIGLIGHDAMYGPQAAFFSELFETRVRYSGISLANQLATVLVGLTPTIATALLIAAGGDPWLVAVYVVAIGVVTLVSVYLASETFQDEIFAEQLQDSHVAADGRKTGAE